VVAKVTERLAVSKEEAQKSDGEIFNLRELNELDVTKQYIKLRLHTVLKLWRA